MVKILWIVLVVGLGYGFCRAEPTDPKPAEESANPSCCAPASSNTADPGVSANDLTLQGILDELHKRTTAMGSYQAKVKYLFIQDPELLDSRAIRKGKIFYHKDPDGSRLRIQFDTLQQEDALEEKRIEQFFFDGLWLTRIDYSLEKADFYQKAKPDKPMDVFEFLSGNFPIIGFTKTENLSKDFEITLIKEKGTDPNQPVHLLLTTRPQSRFREQYTKIDFWIDSKRFLPQRILTASTEGDIYDISFLEPVVNKIIEKAIFTIEIPAHFSQNRHPLEESVPQTDTILPGAAKQSG